MKTLHLIILIFSFHFLSAQIGATINFENYRSIQQGFSTNIGNSQLNIAEIDGSPFLNESFIKGKIVDKNNNMEVETNLRYDVLNDVFEIKLSPTDTELKKLPRSTGYEYILNEKKFILILSESAINELHYDNGNGFVELMTSSYQDNVLYKRYYIEKKEGRKASNTYQKDIPPKFILESRYIIKFKDKFVRVEAHKKRVLEKFPDNIKELKKFIDDNKLKFRGDEEEIDKEMVMLVNYYNSI